MRWACGSAWKLYWTIFNLLLTVQQTLKTLQLRPSGNQKQNKVKICSRQVIATKSPSAHIYGNMSLERQEALYIMNESELVKFHPTVLSV